MLLHILVAELAEAVGQGLQQSSVLFQHVLRQLMARTVLTAQGLSLREQPADNCGEV